MKRKRRACGFDPVAVQSQLKDYLKGDPLPDEKFFIELMSFSAFALSADQASP